MSKLPEHAVLGIEDFKDLPDEDIFIQGNNMFIKENNRGKIICSRIDGNVGTYRDFNDDDSIKHVRLLGV